MRWSWKASLLGDVCKDLMILGSGMWTNPRKELSRQRKQPVPKSWGRIIPRCQGWQRWEWKGQEHGWHVEGRRGPDEVGPGEERRHTFWKYCMGVVVCVCTFLCSHTDCCLSVPENFIKEKEFELEVGGEMRLWQLWKSTVSPVCGSPFSLPQDTLLKITWMRTSF